MSEQQRTSTLNSFSKPGDRTSIEREGQSGGAQEGTKDVSAKRDLNELVADVTDVKLDQDREIR